MCNLVNFRKANRVYVRQDVRIMSLVVYTLTDENFIPAVSALVNSLRMHGFDGEIRIGSPERLSITDREILNVSFFEIGPGDLSITNRKPGFILSQPSESFVYIDADIVVNNPDFLPKVVDWLEFGPVFTVESLVPPSDYRRRVWRKRLNTVQTAEVADRMEYYNAGFFAGKMSRDAHILENWDHSMTRVLQPPGELFCNPDFYAVDQDVLNAVLQDIKEELVTVGPPDIWSAVQDTFPFLHIGTFSGPALLHGTGFNKPWQLKSVPARGPTAYDLMWYHYAVENTSPMNCPVFFKKSVHSWFRGGLYGRMIQKKNQISSRLLR